MLAALLTNPQFYPPESSKVPLGASHLERHKDLLKQDDEIIELLTILTMSRILEE